MRIRLRSRCPVTLHWHRHPVMLGRKSDLFILARGHAMLVWVYEYESDVSNYDPEGNFFVDFRQKPGTPHEYQMRDRFFKSMAEAKLYALTTIRNELMRDITYLWWTEGEAGRYAAMPFNKENDVTETW